MRHQTSRPVRRFQAGVTEDHSSIPHNGERTRDTLRTGSRPAGNRIALRCLLGTPGPSWVQPPVQPGPEHRPRSCAWREAGITSPGSGTGRLARLTALTGWPGGGLGRNLPSIAPLSTRLTRNDAPDGGSMTGLLAVVLRRYD